MNELKHHENWTVWSRKHLRVGANKKVKTVKQQDILDILVELGLTFGNALHLSRRSLTSFGRRFLEEMQLFGMISV
jgi:hypothetical protein